MRAFILFSLSSIEELTLSGPSEYFLCDCNVHSTF
jgi:hypothetical protein